MRRCAFSLIELLGVIVILAILIALLLVALSRMRKAAVSARLGYPAEVQPSEVRGDIQPARPLPSPPPVPMARVQKFLAEVELTPRLSIGTVSPESIYEARFTAKLDAARPTPDIGDCEIELPLPPQIISLADLSVRMDGVVSEQVQVRTGTLVWRGTLPAVPGKPVQLDITYTAVGKGLYQLSVPPGGIVEHFQVKLAANGSDVRLMELSLQPTELSRASGTTTYTWDYKRLLFGQPVRLDVLGIAPIDRLGELTWLGPISVAVFGLLVGLFVHAFSLHRFDRWMLLLTVGTFAGAYPLMYYAQEYVSLSWAVLLSSGLALGIIGIRGVTVIGLRPALAGVILPGGTILIVTLLAAIWPALQGILLTAAALALFIALMLLLPRVRLIPPPSADAGLSLPVESS